MSPYRKARPPSGSLIRTGAAAAALAIALTGCGPDRVVTGSTDALDYRQRHPIVLAEGARSLDVFVTGGAGLDRRQRDDLHAFAAEYRRQGRGAVLAQVPAGGPEEGAAQVTLARIGAALAEEGVPAGALAVRPYPVADPSVAAPVRLSFARLTASVPGPCGLWPGDLGVSNLRQDAGNQAYWNLGCAMQSNVAAQVADPVDLVRGRAEAPPDPIRRGKVIDAVRNGKDPSTEYRQEGTRINRGVGN